MDQMMVDVTAVDDVAPGDDAILIGREGEEVITADELGEWSGTISYEVLPVEDLPGERSVSTSGYIEYNLEEDAGLKWALDALYRPLN